MINKIKLNIQLFAKKEEDDKEISPTEALASLTVDYDILKAEKERIEKELEIEKKAKEDLSKANSRLMTRITEKEEKEEVTVKQDKKVSLADMYDFSTGKLVLKK